jgi:hypothetical protein
MCGYYFADAPYEMTIRCESPAWEERLELGDNGVEPANKLGDALSRVWVRNIHDA